MIYNPDVMFSNKKREIISVINDMIYYHDHTVNEINKYIELQHHSWSETERDFAKKYVKKIKELIEDENK